MKDIFHIHTYRCGHAEMISDEAYVKKAVEMGAESITFTDHAPFPGDPFGNRMKYNELDEYISTLSDLKYKYHDIIRVRIGLEIEYLPGFHSYYEELKGRKELELLMIGQHFYEVESGKYSFSFPEQKGIEYNGFIDSIKQGIGTGMFDVVAHPDRSFRNAGLWSKQCEDKSKELINFATEKGIYLEKNLSSMQTENHFRPQFWELVVPETLIIRGLDAHNIQSMVQMENNVKF